MSTGVVVFSNADDIERLNTAWMALAAAMGRMAGPDFSRHLASAAGEANRSGFGGPLRVDNDLTLVAVKRSSLDDNYFEPPQGAVETRLPETPAVNETGGGERDGIVAETARETGKEIGGAAADEAKTATVEEVREEVRGFFNKLLKND